MSGSHPNGPTPSFLNAPGHNYPSTTNNKLGLILHHLALLLVQPHNLCQPRALVDMLEEGGDGVVVALGFALDLDWVWVVSRPASQPPTGLLRPEVGG